MSNQAKIDPDHQVLIKNKINSNIYVTNITFIKIMFRELLNYSHYYL